MPRDTMADVIVEAINSQTAAIIEEIDHAIAAFGPPIGTVHADTLDRLGEYLSVRDDDMAIYEMVAPIAALSIDAAEAHWLRYQTEMERKLTDAGGPTAVQAALLTRDLRAAKPAIATAQQQADRRTPRILPPLPPISGLDLLAQHSGMMDSEGESVGAPPTPGGI